MLLHRKGLECQVEMFSRECFVGRSFQWSGLSLSSGCFVFLSWAQSPSVFYLFFVELNFVCGLPSLISEDGVIFLWELRPITLPTVLLEASLGVLN